MEANVKTVTPKRKAEANDEKIVTKSNTKQQNSTVTSVKHIVKPNIHSVGQFACDIPGKRCFDVRGVSFVVHEKYNIVKVIGVGAYGIVTAAMDMQTGQKVALKKISGVFEDATDTKRVLREIRLMKALNHENILPIYDIEAPESLEEFEDVYISSPLYDKDLGRVLESNVELRDEHHQYFVYQILCALKYLHSASVLHRDLKPANILIQESCDVCICDFGLARYVEEADGMQKGMTEYVVTRWYRAPELVLTHEYTSAVDLWAVGCIIGDLLGRKVLFPGKDFKNQVETICAVLGRPNEEESKHVTSTRAKGFLEKLPDTNKVPFKEMFPCANPDAVDLMEKLLVFNPEKRLTAKQALKHAYVKAFHQEEFEPVFESADLSDIEPRSASGNALNVMEMKRMVISEIYNFRPEAGIFVQHPELIPRKG